MACIDIFAPGRVLNVPLLVEQIWLEVKGKQLRATEIYDFLLECSDNRELSDFFVASPHFCRQRSNDGWSDTATLSQVRSVGWGWFYIREVVQEKTGILQMTVPNSLGPPARDTLDFEGLDVTDAKMSWAEDLVEKQRLEMMADIKKSLYKIHLPTPLKALSQNAMWFRLVVQPTQLDIPGIRRFLEHHLIQFVVPFYLLTANITSPTEVRRSVVSKLDQIRSSDQVRRALADDLMRRIVREGFDKPGTTTRVEDHRVLLGTYSPLHLSIHGQPVPTLGFFGAQPVQLNLPIDGKSRSRTPTSAQGQLKKVDANVYQWSGGSVRNLERDLVTVVRALLHEAKGAPSKTKEELATRMAPWRYAEACLLLDNMEGKGLINFNGGKCNVIQLSNPEELRRISELRDLYTRPEHFEASPRARFAFTDTHAFRIDFTVSWISTNLVQRLIIVGGAISSVLGLILAIIALSRT